MADLSLQIQELRHSQNQIKVIHYGCESWFEVKDRPVAISCIAIVDLETRDQVSFSLTDYKDPDAERHLLEQYYKYIRQTPDTLFLHWNMHSSDYGFAAIDKRFTFLFGADPPYTVPRDKRYDLDSLISHKYGGKYADHPKLATMGVLNRFSRRISIGDSTQGS